jgi:hypothetical protein
MSIRQATAEDAWEETEQVEEVEVTTRALKSPVKRASAVKTSHSSPRRRVAIPIIVASPKASRKGAHNKSGTVTPASAEQAPLRAAHSSTSPAIPPASSRLAINQPASSQPTASLPTSQDLPSRHFTALITAVNLLGTIGVNIGRILNTFLGPFFPYIYLTILAILLISGIIYYITHHLPTHLYNLIFRIIPFARSSGNIINYLEYPARITATPLCALTGILCEVSLISQNGTSSIGGGFWKWKWKWNWSRGTGDQVDVGGVARSLTKEVMGAKDIFESIAMLSEGGMTDRLEYVRYVIFEESLFFALTVYVQDLGTGNCYLSRV